jgi:hypothetical protein
VLAVAIVNAETDELESLILITLFNVSVVVAKIVGGDVLQFTANPLAPEVLPDPVPSV